MVSKLVSAPKAAEQPECPAEVSLEREWQTFQRELGQLLAEGNAGRFALIRADELIGVWDTEDEALEPFLVQPVIKEEPTLRAGVTWRCRT